MIEIILTPQEETRSREKSCFYLAECTADGIAYETRSRHGASYALARVLVGAAVADQPVRVVQRGHKGHLQYGSLHEMALWTVSEGRSGLTKIRWHPSPDFKTVYGENTLAKNSDETVSATSGSLEKTPA